MTRGMRDAGLGIEAGKAREESSPSRTGSGQKDGEAWFAEEAIRKKDGDLLDNVSFN